ncbi:hypothetical protein [Kordia sp.]|uniref:hypothetical protein n=1 Tax=Kordia sp. TaxID=1965332 RepID=UPI003D6A7D66
MNTQGNNQNDFKKTAIDDYKYYGRRVEIVSMIICGFGLYGNVKLVELIRPRGAEEVLVFVISLLLFLICIMLNLKNLIFERDIRGHYIAMTTDVTSDEQKQKSFNKSITLEDKSKKFINISYTLMCIAMFLPILYLVVMMLT